MNIKKLKEFPREFIKINIDIHLLKEQILKASNYNKPSGMDDRWYVTCESDIINFYRTWTGSCIYRVKMNNEKNRLIQLDINNNLEQYKFSNIEEEIVLFDSIFNLLLPPTKSE